MVWGAAPLSVAEIGTFMVLINGMKCYFYMSVIRFKPLLLTNYVLYPWKSCNATTNIVGTQRKNALGAKRLKNPKSKDRCITRNNGNGKTFISTQCGSHKEGKKNELNRTLQIICTAGKLIKFECYNGCKTTMRRIGYWFGNQIPTMLSGNHFLQGCVVYGRGVRENATVYRLQWHTESTWDIFQ